MATLRLITARDPRLLLESAADEFLSPLRAPSSDPFPSPSYLLVLRQGGLRDDLVALAAERGVPGWFDPPLCVFHELPTWLGATRRKPCGDFERAALVANVMRQAAGGVFRRVRRIEDFLRAIDRLFGELVGEAMSPDAFEEAVQKLKIRDEFGRKRDAELAAAFRLYCRELERAGLRDGRDALVDCATAVRKDPDALAARLRGRREIRIFGLHDLRGGWRLLLKELVKSPVLDRVLVYASQPIDLPNELAAGHTPLEEPETMASRLFTSEERARGTFAVIEAPNVEREVGEVARRVRELVDRGVAPHRIAVVARRARPYVDLVLRALDKFGVPGTARRRFAYREISVVKAVLALFRAAAENWPRHALVDLAEQPYFASDLDVRALNFVGFRRVLKGLEAWEQALRELEREARAYEQQKERDERSKPPPPVERVSDARRAFASFAGLARDLDIERSFEGWLRWLLNFVEVDPWQIENQIYQVPEERFDIARRDLAGWRGLKQIVGEWVEALKKWGGGEELMPVMEFHQRLQEMLDGDAALWTETMRGVRVLEGLAAVYRTFDHVFLVGMDAGRFPVHAPVSPIFDEADRAALGQVGLRFDLREHWDAREQNVFRTLVAGAAESLTLSYARLDFSGRERIRSAFVEALADVAIEDKQRVDATEPLTPGMPLYRSADVLERARHGVQVERLRETGELSPYNGLVEDPELLLWLEERFGDDHLWSPTRIEQFAKCPWAFYSSRLLRLEKPEDPDQDMDPIVRGSVLHDALRRFFNRLSEEANGPVFLREEHLELAGQVLGEALDDALEHSANTVWIGHPSLREAKRAELQRILLDYLRWEVGIHEDMYNKGKQKAPRMLRTAPHQHERRFEDVVLDRHGVRFRFRGSIDRVEIGVDERIKSPETFLAAVDYKTTKSSAPGAGQPGAWDEGVVLQVPLYAHALAQLEPGHTVCRVEYQALKNCEAVHRLELHQVNKKTEIRFQNDADLARMEQALDHVVQHVRDVRAGKFPADPADSCGCPPFCHAWDICRVAGGHKPTPKDR